MEAPRQKLIKESATVVATTTFGAIDRRRPSVDDILWLSVAAFEGAETSVRRNPRTYVRGCNPIPESLCFCGAGYSAGSLLPAGFSVARQKAP